MKSHIISLTPKSVIANIQVTREYMMTRMTFFLNIMKDHDLDSNTLFSKFPQLHSNASHL